jgi:4-amino-4-deoxy-L-arabinose transferase-like glycosyltransferase
VSSNLRLRNWNLPKKGLNILVSIIFIAAAYFRYDFLVSVNHHVSHDSIYYNEMVHRLMDKGVYAYKSEQPNAHVTPGYPLFMLGMTIAGDWLHQEAFALIRYAQAMLSLVTIGLIYIIARRLTRRTTVAVASAAVSAVYAPFIWATGAVLTETLAQMLLMLYLLAQIHAFDTGRKVHAAAAGLLLGLTVLVRPEFLPLFVPLYGLYFLQQWRKRSLAQPAEPFLPLLRRIVVLTVITGLCLSAVMLPWWVRNLVSLHAVVLTATQTNPFAAGTYPNKDYSDRIVDPRGKTQDEVAWERIRAGFTQQTWTYVKWFTVGKMTYIYLNMFGGSGHAPTYLAVPYSGAPLHLSVIYLSLPVLLVLVWRWRHPAAVLAAVLLFMTLIRLLFVPEFRYNFTVMPLIIIFACWGPIVIVEMRGRMLLRLRGIIVTGKKIAG